MRGVFAWENKAPGKNLDAALKQLLTYSLALSNPPILVVSDRLIIPVHRPPEPDAHGGHWRTGSARQAGFAAAHLDGTRELQAQTDQPGHYRGGCQELCDIG